MKFEFRLLFEFRTSVSDHNFVLNLDTVYVPTVSYKMYGK